MGNDPGNRADHSGGTVIRDAAPSEPEDKAARLEREKLELLDSLAASDFSTLKN